MYPIYLRVYWQKMADIELWRVPMSAFRACVRSESAGQCPWVIAKRAPQMPGGQGVAGSNPVHPTSKREATVQAVASFRLNRHALPRDVTRCVTLSMTTHARAGRTLGDQPPQRRRPKGLLFLRVQPPRSGMPWGILPLGPFSDGLPRPHRPATLLRGVAANPGMRVNVFDSMAP